MATSEERREVAARLRRAADFGEWLDLTIENAIFDVMGEVRRPIADVLADLVDPTCEVDSIEPVEDELGQTVGYEFHLTCGHSVTQPYNGAPAYCDKCGARVVDDD